LSVRWSFVALLLSASVAGAEEDRPRLIGSVHLYPMTSFPDLLGGQITVHAIPWVDIHAGLSAFPGRFGWWVRGGPRFVIADFRDENHRGLTWRISALAGYRAFRDSKADAHGFSAQLSTDITHFFQPHLGLTFQAACGGMYDDAAKRVLPEIRLGVGLSF
jgi:hypothetical protein